MHHTVMVVASLCPLENKKEESKPHHKLADVAVKVTSQFIICLILISPPPWLNLEAPKWRQELPFNIYLVTRNGFLLLETFGESEDF